MNVLADGGDGTMYGGQWPKQACTAWGPSMNTSCVHSLFLSPKNHSILLSHTHARARASFLPIYSRTAFGVTIAGEFSNGFNDCGLFIRGVGGSASSAANCTFWNDITQWDDNSKAGLMNFAMASMDALGDWFFWTWKVRFVFLFFLFIDFSFSFSLHFVRRLETPQQQGKSTPPCGPTN